LDQLISETVGRELRAAAYQAKGMNPSTVQEIEAIRVPLVSLNPRKAAGEERVGLGDRIRQWIPSAFVYLLWVAVFVSSQMLLTSVIEEKSNRIIEVLLSSVTPEELMTGKLFGIALTGLTMLFLWIASAMGVLYLNTSKGSVAGTAENIPVDLLNLLQTTWLLPAFLGYFILGFLVFATFFLALGSTCNTLKEAQNMMGMVMPVLIVPLLTIPFIPRDPNGTLARVLSWIPPFTPFVMMNRVTGHPPILDVVGTLLLLGGFVAFEVWAAARIFRVGVLRTGQPPKWLEMARWLRSGA
jgi:ABC-2 type transport system permease protein